MGNCFCQSDEKDVESANPHHHQHRHNGHAGMGEAKKSQVNFGNGGKCSTSLLLNPMANSAKKKVSENSVASSSKGVGLGISMMMYQAGMLAGYGPPTNVIDLNSLRAQMRKAKAEGRTVTVLNGCVYIDYQLKAQIPPGFNFEI